MMGIRDISSFLWALGIAIQPVAVWRVVEADLNGAFALCCVALVILGTSRAISWVKANRVTERMASRIALAA